MRGVLRGAVPILRSSAGRLDGFDGRAGVSKLKNGCARVVTSSCRYGTVCKETEAARSPRRQAAHRPFDYARGGWLSCCSVATRAGLRVDWRYPLQLIASCRVGAGPMAVSALDISAVAMQAMCIGRNSHGSPWRPSAPCFIPAWTWRKTEECIHVASLSTGSR
jgi:hypothetical protein